MFPQQSPQPQRKEKERPLNSMRFEWRAGSFEFSCSSSSELKAIAFNHGALRTRLGDRVRSNVFSFQRQWCHRSLVALGVPVFSAPKST
jgi:hypothetical protein